MTSPKQWKQNNPYKYAYQTLKDNAKRRGKEFDLTFEEFKSFCHNVDYIQNKGKTSRSLTIDRIDERLGYTKENIQALPLSDNIRKFLSYDWQTKEARIITIHKTNKIDFDEI